MTQKLHFQFDSHLDFQLEAIQAVLDVFDGVPAAAADYTWGSDVVPNLPPYQDLNADHLYRNVLALQQRTDPQSYYLKRPERFGLDIDEDVILPAAGPDTHRYPSFTVEMETGTGKTYVYLRTLYELRQRFGFRKFIIVVPSIAIYEGVVKNFEITRAHLASLYNNEVVNLIRYDSSRMSALRTFATSNFVEVLVITIASFNGPRNRIYQPSEQLPGEWRPFEYLQATRPILILDEPQNMESDLSRAALRTLKPLFALRYSATHKTTPNHIYCLTPFEAYRRDLVKKIQVDAVTERDDFNRPFLSLEAIQRQPRLAAQIKTYTLDRGRTQEATLTLHHGDDLHARTGREEHRAGYTVSAIDAARKVVEFANGVTLHLQETIGPSRPEIFRVQIERTLLTHMQRQAELRDEGIKVLSLFFIDRVANYVDEDGLIKRLFDEAFDRLKTRFPHFRDLAPAQVRRAYFAEYRRSGQPAQAVDTDNRNQTEREAEKAAFELIMRDKERLLSFDEPVCFIFAHSALKEGWDNPNVFQICTLNQTLSTMKKRQEIGRGLRLPVDQTGVRVHDPDVNILTVIANESYETYAATLQQEYVDEGHATPPPKPGKAHEATANRNDAIFQAADFQAFWQKLIRQTTYHLHIDTPALIAECVERLNATAFPKSVIVIETGQYVVTEFTVTLDEVRREKAKLTLRITDSEGASSQNTFFAQRNTDLAQEFDKRLQGFKITAIIAAGDDSYVTFYNDKKLSLGEPFTFQSQAGQRPRVSQTRRAEQTYPIFNLVARAAEATHLTRPTLNAIFHAMSEDKKAQLPQNPEGFAAVFIAEIQEALAWHVIRHIEFTLSDTLTPYDLEKLFPPTRLFPQKELIPAGATCLYDQVQIDSGVEEAFVTQRLHPDPNVIAYFKFPPTFKIPFPKIIGNYNPDWGILRYNDTGAIVLELVRETKGGEELETLRFPHEQRKVTAAQKHFRAVGLDYRVITDATPDWWLPSDTLPSQEKFDEQ